MDKLNLRTTLTAGALTVAVALTGLLLLPGPANSTGEQLTLEEDYLLTLYFDPDSQYSVDTSACQDATITGEGWTYAWLWMNSSTVEFAVGIPDWSPTLSSFTFCGDPIDAWDEQYYVMSLDSYETLAGGNKLKLTFDIPTSPDDLEIVLEKGKPFFKVLWDGEVKKGLASPSLTTEFDWTIE